MAPDTHATGSGAIMQERHRDLLDQTALDTPMTTGNCLGSPQ